MIDYKNLTDDELLNLIDYPVNNSKELSDMKKLAMEDTEFANRLLNISTQWVIDDLNKLLNTLPLNSPIRQKVQEKIAYYTQKFKKIND